MDGYDGPTLRSLRETQGVPLRRVARQAGMSPGHLSKVERGEPGRPVTPAVLSAYEKATGIRLSGVAGHEPDESGWRRGHLSEPRRKILNAKVAAIAVGGPLGEHLGRILDGTGRALPPTLVEDPQAATLEQVGQLLTELDLRYGGAVVDQISKALLRWAIGLLEDESSNRVGPRLPAAAGSLAQRAGWAAFDADSHDVARSLFTVALYAANRADEPNLRAHILADLAGQHNYLGYPEDALQVVRLGEIDERIHPMVQMVIHAVKARCYATRGETEACLRHIQLAEHAQITTTDAEGWLASVATPAQLYATTGHAAATLARRTGREDARTDATRRLTTAIDEYDLDTHPRAAALCMAQLASLHLDPTTTGGEVGDGELAAGLMWARQCVTTAAGIDSARLVDHLHALKRAAAGHDHDSEIKQLLVDIDAIVGHGGRQ